MNYLKRNQYWIIPTFTVFMVFSLFLCLTYQILQPKARLTCRDFGSYADALVAYKNGNFELDADHDGIPCEGMLPRTLAVES